MQRAMDPRTEATLTAISHRFGCSMEEAAQRWKSGRGAAMAPVPSEAPCAVELTFAREKDGKLEGE